MDDMTKCKVLSNQVNLNFVIMDLTEEELIDIICDEQNGNARPRYLNRAYGRLSKIRRRRESVDLSNHCFSKNIDTNKQSTGETLSLIKLLDEQDAYTNEVCSRKEHLPKHIQERFI